jgi:3-oxoadipate enol-lactonase
MGDDVTVLFLHPIAVGRHSATWLQLPPHVAPDFPGHGPRAIPHAGLSLDEIADEIAGWVHTPMHVIGALMGGTVGLHLALRHPELVRSLIVADTSARADHDGMLRRSEIVAAGDRQLEWTLDRWFGEATMALDPLPEPVAYARAALSTIPLESLAASWRAMSDHDVVADLERITMPTTVIAGRYDVVNDLEKQEELAHALPQARLAVIEAQHMAPLDNPAEFSRAIADHIAWAEERLAGGIP